MKIRHPVPGDLSNIIKVAKASSDGIVPNNKMIYYIFSTVLSPFSLVAEIDNKVVGILFAIPNSHEEYLWIHQWAVDPKFRGSGYGNSLMEEFEKKIFKKDKYNCIRFAVNPTNKKALKFYKKLGFKDLGIDDCIDYHIYEKCRS